MDLKMEQFRRKILVQESTYYEWIHTNFRWLNVTKNQLDITRCPLSFTFKHTHEGMLETKSTSTSHSCLNTVWMYQLDIDQEAQPMSCKCNDQWPLNIHYQVIVFFYKNTFHLIKTYHQFWTYEKSMCWPSPNNQC